MYVLIDRSNMRFIATHDSNVCLRHLSHIELPHVAVIICPADTPADFRTFTDLELRLLYRNTTGGDHSNAIRNSLLASCVSLAQQIPERELNAFEVQQQAQCIPEDDQYNRFRYAPGQYKPIREADLFEPAPLTCQQSWDASRLAEFARKLPPLQAPIAAAATSAPASVRSPAARPASTPRAAPAAPRGGGRQLIWERMDRIWEKAGKPKDIKVVLGLRKACMDELENECGVKRTSASSELGNWMKMRVTE